MGNFYWEKLFHARKKIRKSDFTPSEKYSSYTTDVLVVLGKQTTKILNADDDNGIDYTTMTDDADEDYTACAGLWLSPCFLATSICVQFIPGQLLQVKLLQITTCFTPTPFGSDHFLTC